MSKICEFFQTSAGCLFGADCIDRHSSSASIIAPIPIQKVTKLPSFRPSVPRVFNDSINNKLKSTTDPFEKALLLRQIETLAIKKRFNISELDGIFNIKLLPTDPDFPFDLEFLNLELTVPIEYPIKKSTLKVCNLEIPLHIRNHVQFSWINKSERTKFTLLELINWLDRDLERLLSYSGDSNISFVKNDSETRQIVDREFDVQQIDVKQTADVKQSDEPIIDDEPSFISNETETQPSTTNLNSQHKGIQVKIQNLQLLQISLLTSPKLTLLLKCNRCKSNNQSKIQNNTPFWIACRVCNLNIGVDYRPDYIHENSNSVGYLDTSNCKPFEVTSLSVVCTCFNCDTESAEIKECVSDKNYNLNCLSCFKKLSFAFDGFKLVNLAPTSLEAPLSTMSLKKKKVESNLGLSIGEQLPKKGTCKHFGKSYRWFRYPCCNMLYPCDSCHDSASDGHELVRGNRIVCGFCSVEQKISSICKGCNKELAKKVTGTGAFWEGGQGIRDKSKMNRNEPKKYAGLGKVASNKKVGKKLE